MFAGPKEQQVTLEIPFLDSSGPATVSGSRGTHCPIANCSGVGLKRHAFECHLPGISEKNSMVRRSPFAVLVHCR